MIASRVGSGLLHYGGRNGLPGIEPQGYDRARIESETGPERELGGVDVALLLPLLLIDGTAWEARLAEADSLRVRVIEWTLDTMPKGMRLYDTRAEEEGRVREGKEREKREGEWEN